MENNEVVVRLPGSFESNAEAAGFIQVAVLEALKKLDGYWSPVAVVWKDRGEPWRMLVDGEGASEVEKGLVFSE